MPTGRQKLQEKKPKQKTHREGFILGHVATAGFLHVRRIHTASLGWGVHTSLGVRTPATYHTQLFKTRGQDGQINL